MIGIVVFFFYGRCSFFFGGQTIISDNSQYFSIDRAWTMRTVFGDRRAIPLGWAFIPNKIGWVGVTIFYFLKRVCHGMARLSPVIALYHFLFL
jgi:hypothetical protein